MDQNEEIVISGYVGNNGEIVVDSGGEKSLYWVTQNGSEKLMFLSVDNINNLVNRTTTLDEINKIAHDDDDDSTKGSSIAESPTGELLAEKPTTGRPPTVGLTAKLSTARPPIGRRSKTRPSAGPPTAKSTLTGNEQLREEPSSSAGPSRESGARLAGKWTDTEAEGLIAAYKEVSDASKGSDVYTPSFWKKVSGLMATQCVKKTWLECREKWKSLDRTYKSHVAAKNSTGTSPRVWPLYEDFHAVMHKKPQITPVAIASSISGFKRRIAEDIDDFEKPFEKEPISKEAKTKRQSKEAPDWIKEVRAEAAARHEERKKQHEENKEKKDEVIELCRELVNLKKKEFQQNEK